MNNLYVKELIEKSLYIKKQFIHLSSEEGEEDPLHEDEFRPVPTIIHRFENRVLFLLKYTCPMICAFCTRKRLHKYNTPTKEEINEGIEYIQKHKIEEVIFSGGEPLWNEESFIIEIIDKLGPRIIRIHTRLPLMMPDEIYKLKKIFKKRPYIVTHFNHPDELSSKVLNALKFMEENGARLFNQSVLLKGINDKEEILYELFLKLYKNGIKPYYLHQLDKSKGSVHFETKEEEGVKIMESLSKKLPGLAMPIYVKDIPFSKAKKRIL